MMRGHRRCAPSFAGSPALGRRALLRCSFGAVPLHGFSRGAPPTWRRWASACWACAGLLALGMPSAAAQAQTPIKNSPSADTRAAQDATQLNNRGVEAAQAGHIEQGIALVRQAVQLAPSDAQLHRNLSGMLTDWARQLAQQGKDEQMRALLEEAVQHDPTNGAALVLLGNHAYMTQTDLTTAIEWWKRAFGHIPSEQWQMIATRIAQAERDRALERHFIEATSAHFRLRFEQPEAAPQIATLGRVLESAYARLAATLGSAPPRLTVIVYTGQDFQRVVGRRDWAVGLYDGRIRFRLDEIGAEYAPQILAHELAHAALAQTYGAHLPIWIHEGFAQSQEPPKPLTERQQALLTSIRTRTAWVPLKWLDRRFEQPSNLEDVERAYVQARWVVETLMQRYGVSRFQQFLAALAGGAPIERAFDQTFAPLSWARADQGGFE